MLNLAHQRRLHLSKRLPHSEPLESRKSGERAKSKEPRSKAKSRGAKLRAEEQSQELKSAEPFVFSEASL